MRRHVAVATLNRPRALNALNTGMVESMFELYSAWEADPGVACILLKASAPSHVAPMVCTHGLHAPGSLALPEVCWCRACGMLYDWACGTLHARCAAFLGPAQLSCLHRPEKTLPCCPAITECLDSCLAERSRRGSTHEQRTQSHCRAVPSAPCAGRRREGILRWRGREDGCAARAGREV